MNTEDTQKCSSVVLGLAPVAQLDVHLTGDQEIAGSNPPPGQEHSFVEIDHEIFFTIILSSADSRRAVVSL